MPTVGGDQLTAAHQTLQARGAARTASALDRLWVSFQTGSITETEWMRAVTVLLGVAHTVSAATASNYYQAIRAAETGLAAAPVGFAVSFDATRAAQVADRGLSRWRSYLTSMSAVEAAARAGRESTGALVEVGLDGGRGQVIGMVQSDPAAQGWYRVSDGDPCAFCALMVSRGNVYKSESAARFASHPKCGCGARPAFDRTRFATAESERLHGLYERSTRGQTDQLNAFRRAYERPHLHDA